MLKAAQAIRYIEDLTVQMRADVMGGEIDMLRAAAKVNSLVAKLKPITEDWDIVEAAIAEKYS